MEGNAGKADERKIVDAKDETKDSKNAQLHTKLSSAAIKNIEVMKKEFENRRKILVTNTPIADTSSHVKLMEDIIGNKDFRIVYNSKETSFRMVFPSSEAASAALNKINNPKNGKMSAHYGHPDSLLFIGNLPLTYDSKQLQELFASHGDILRCFVVYSAQTGESKGYGFVEYSTREEACNSKTNMSTKLVGARALRVDFADNGMQTVEDLQSKTIFIDKLPKGLSEEMRIVNIIGKYGTVNFCQIALLPNGCPRGFAFVDMSSSTEAEAVQKHCNGVKLDGQEIRVSYGMPCRPGACILQPRHSNGAWNPNLVPPNIIGPSKSVRPPPPPLPRLILNNDAIVQFNGRKEPPCPPPGVGLPPCPAPLYPHTAQLHVHPLPRKEFVMNYPNDCYLNVQSSNGVPKSTGSNSTRSSSPCLSISSNGDNASNKENQPQKESVAGQKRQRLHEDQELMAVYDKPYIGQHDQGILFQHPLKRIKRVES